MHAASLVIGSSVVPFEHTPAHVAGSFILVSNVQTPSPSSQSSLLLCNGSLQDEQPAVLVITISNVKAVQKGVPAGVHIPLAFVHDATSVPAAVHIKPAFVHDASPLYIGSLHASVLHPPTQSFSVRKLGLEHVPAFTQVSSMGKLGSEHVAPFQVAPASVHIGVPASQAPCVAKPGSEHILISGLAGSSISSVIGTEACEIPIVINKIIVHIPLKAMLFLNIIYLRFYFGLLLMIQYSSRFCTKLS